MTEEDEAFGWAILIFLTIITILVSTILINEHQ